MQYASLDMRQEHAALMFPEMPSIMVKAYMDLENRNMVACTCSATVNPLAYLKDPSQCFCNNGIRQKQIDLHK